MINTIFYFCPTEEEYNSTVQGEGISKTTVVFVEDSGAIYVNGKRYGGLAQELFVKKDDFLREKEAIYNAISEVSQPTA